MMIKTIMFDEFVAYGLAHSKNTVNGVPWSFDYAGHPITHENDDCYLIPTLQGIVKFNRGDMLITNENGELSVERSERHD